MLAGMLAQIDQTYSSCYRGERSINDYLWLSHKGDYRPIVIGIKVAVQNNGAFDGRNGVGNLFDRLDLAALAEVWYTLNEGIWDFRLLISDLTIHVSESV
jgi:hypothetical protein